MGRMEPSNYSLNADIRWVLTRSPSRTLVYVEGDASMRVYQDAEGKKQSSLNVVQRTYPSIPSAVPSFWFMQCNTDIPIRAGNIEILKRPNREAITEMDSPAAAAGGA